jgi:stearoyl-CoA desaturase (delta-9 desaturase)
MAKNLKRTPEKAILNARLAVIQEQVKEETKFTSLRQRTSFSKMNIDEMEQKIKAGRILFIVDGYVIDVEPYIQEHPGGAEILNSYVGTDATDAFYGGVNAHSSHAQSLLQGLRIAKFDEN